MALFAASPTISLPTIPGWSRLGGVACFTPALAPGLTSARRLLPRKRAWCSTSIPAPVVAAPLASRLPGDAMRLDLAAAFAALEGADLSFVETGPTHQGPHRIDPDHALRQIGDVVLSRKGEDIVAYFLAAALDDADQGVTHVIRGEDLFDFTPVQVILQHLFGLPTPVYHHHRLIRDNLGKRLAKRDDARALAKYRAEGATPADIRRMVGLAG